MLIIRKARKPASQLACEENAADKDEGEDGSHLHRGTARAGAVYVLVASILVAVEEALNLFQGAALWVKGSTGTRKRVEGVSAGTREECGTTKKEAKAVSNAERRQGMAHKDAFSVVPETPRPFHEQRYTSITIPFAPSRSFRFFSSSAVSPYLGLWHVE